MSHSIRWFALALLVLVTGRDPVAAQCLEWHAFPEAGPELVGDVLAAEVHDDGSGSALYVSGDLSLSTSGAHSAVMRWNGTAYSPVGSLPSGTVRALTRFDDGTGPALYAVLSHFNLNDPSTLFKWNGAAWLSLGDLDGMATAMTVHDDGSGPALYVAGFFHNAGAVSTPGVARWDGATWSALGPGPFGVGSVSSVTSLASVDDGFGPALFVGGTFHGQPWIASAGVAKWQGGSWFGVGGGIGPVQDLAVWDDGTGPALFAARPGSATGTGIRRWNGMTWQTFANPVTAGPSCLRVLDGGMRLYVGTFGTYPTYRSEVFVRDVSGWTHIAPNVGDECPEPGGVVHALALYPPVGATRLVAGTTSGALGNPLAYLSQFDGSAWNSLGREFEGVNGSLRAMSVHDNGAGAALYIGGIGICHAGSTPVSNVARWGDTGWQAAGALTTAVTALGTCDFGSGSVLMAGDHESGRATLSRFDGSFWTTLGSTAYAPDAILSLQQFGAELYIGGGFSGMTSPTNLLSTNIVRWNPVAGFSSPGGVDGTVNAMTTFDDGSGLALYAGGSFTHAVNLSSNHIARFDGSNWTTLGSGMNSLVDALTTFDDGTGNALYAAGTFTTAGGIPASCVARWNGTTWSALGAGLNAQVLTLEVFDDGSGPALYAGGNFTASGNSPMERIARWNGASWSAVGGNIDGTVWTLKSFDDGTGVGPQLFVGGVFHHAGTLPSENFAAWRGCGGTISKFCFGDGSAGACPCGNAGLSGRGCDNAVHTGGARLNATGTTNPDTIVLHSGGELPNTPTLVFQGTSTLSQPSMFGDGLRCVGGNLKRLFTTSAVGGAISVPDATQMSISARSAALGDPLVPGSVRSYQAWYRDPNLSFCAPPAGDAWNLSNAVRIVW